MQEHAQLLARDISGPVIQLLRNLQGQHGDEWLDATNRFLRKENPWPVHEPPQITVWKEFHLDRYATADKLWRALGEHKYCEAFASYQGSTLLLKPKPARLKIVKISVYDLGLRVGASYRDVLRLAAQLGLVPVPGNLIRLVAAYVAHEHKDESFYGVSLEVPAPLDNLGFNGERDSVIFQRYATGKFLHRLGHDFIPSETQMIFTLATPPSDAAKPAND